MSITIEGALVQESSAVGQNEGKINKETQLLNILSNTTQLYLEMLKINVELKKTPDQKGWSYKYRNYRSYVALKEFLSW